MVSASLVLQGLLLLLDLLYPVNHNFSIWTTLTLTWRGTLFRTFHPPIQTIVWWCAFLADPGDVTDLVCALWHLGIWHGIHLSFLGHSVNEQLVPKCIPRPCSLSISPGIPVSLFISVSPSLLLPHILFLLLFLLVVVVAWLVLALVPSRALLVRC